MSTTAADPTIVKLNNVRLSFPYLFKVRQPKEGDTGEPKYSAAFLLDKQEHAELIARLEKLIDRIALDHWKKKVGFKRCLRDGNEKPETDGYGDGVMFINASSKIRPPVVDRDKSPITEEDGKVYGGCYVNASIRLWVQDNKYGKRVNAELRAVQFVRDGDSFGAGRVDADAEFETVSEDGADII